MVTTSGIGKLGRVLLPRGHSGEGETVIFGQRKIVGQNVLPRVVIGIVVPHLGMGCTCVGRPPGGAVGSPILPLSGVHQSAIDLCAQREALNRLQFQIANGVNIGGTRVVGILVFQIVAQRSVLVLNILRIQFALLVAHISERESSECGSKRDFVSAVVNLIDHIGREAHLCPREDLLVDIQPQRILVEQFVTQQALVSTVHGRGVDIGLVTASGDGERILLRGGPVARSLVHPVYPLARIVGIYIVLIAFHQGCDILWGRPILIGISFTVVGSPLVTRHAVLELRASAPTEIGVEIDAHLSGRAPLGGDDDHAIGSGRTVDGRGRSVFQHIHALNVVGIHFVVVARKSVNDEQRGVIAIDGAGTAEEHFHAATQLTARLGDVEAGHLALQRLHHIVGGRDGDIFRLHGGYGSRQVFLLYRAVAYHNHLVESQGIGLKGGIGVAHGNFARLVAGVGEFELVLSPGHLNCVVAINVGNGTDGGPGHPDGHANERLAGLIDNVPFHLTRLLDRLGERQTGCGRGVCLRGNRQEHSQCQNSTGSEPPQTEIVF